MEENQGRPLYLALSGPGLIEVGGDAESLLRRLREEEKVEEDTVIWRQDEQGGLRLVAAVRPGVGGRTNVTWL